LEHGLSRLDRAASRLAGFFSNVFQAPAILNGRYSLTNIAAMTNQFCRLKK
jgi:hypothetical protein